MPAILIFLLTCLALPAHARMILPPPAVIWTEEEIMPATAPHGEHRPARACAADVSGLPQYAQDAQLALCVEDRMQREAKVNGPDDVRDARRRLRTQLVEILADQGGASAAADQLRATAQDDLTKIASFFCPQGCFGQAAGMDGALVALINAVMAESPSSAAGPVNTPVVSAAGVATVSLDVARSLRSGEVSRTRGELTPPRHGIASSP